MNRWQAFFFLDETSSRNPALEGLRGYLMAVVFFVHAISAYAFAHRHLYYPNLPERPLLAHAATLEPQDVLLLGLTRGNYAVDFFFLLSGFLIMRITARLDGPRSYFRYLWDRMIRIYPPFLLTLGPCIAIYCFWLKTVRLRLPDLLANLFFLNGSGLHVIAYNFPTWSLFFELVFYLGFPVVYHLLIHQIRRDGPSGQPLRAALLLTGVLLTAAIQPRFAMFYFGVFLGMADTKVLYRLAGALRTSLVVAIYVGVTLVFALLPVNVAHFIPIFGIASSLLFIKSGFDDGFLNRVFRWSAFRWLGNVSYSMYLIHGVCLAAVDRWLARPLAGMNTLLALPIYLGAALALTIVATIPIFACAERWYFQKTAPKPPRSVVLSTAA
jgi:peptidoglycan/LPS O-acetylase OafA/YrhL